MQPQKCPKCKSSNTYSRQYPPRVIGGWGCKACGNVWDNSGDAKLIAEGVLCATDIKHAVWLLAEDLVATRGLLQEARKKLESPTTLERETRFQKLKADAQKAKDKLYCKICDTYDEGLARHGRDGHCAQCTWVSDNQPMIFTWVQSLLKAKIRQYEANSVHERDIGYGNAQ